MAGAEKAVKDHRVIRAFRVRVIKAPRAIKDLLELTGARVTRGIKATRPPFLAPKETKAMRVRLALKGIKAQ